MVVCPGLTPPENGFFIQNVCNNQFNSACGVRCLPGFDLHGDKIRLCQPDGTWSGVQPSCRGKRERDTEIGVSGQKVRWEWTLVDCEGGLSEVKYFVIMTA